MPALSSSSRVIIVMGVSGSGKSEIGQRLAARLHGRFHDADQFHPPENVAKMSAGIPLTDPDRLPWLERMRDEIILATPPNSIAVLACSALKRSYRETLRARLEDVWIVYLQGTFDLILARISARQGHFMKADLLRSQFATLEEPTDEPRVLTVSIDQEIESIVEEILRHLSFKPSSRA